MSEKMYLIGNAHLDPVWQWCYPEGLSLVTSTFKAALDRMDEFPDYVFTSACAAYYKWIACTEPELFERIKEKVKEGRWAISGGMWVQPDCNIPSGESFARHFLYSQRFFKEHFGFTPESGYNVDSFGHNGMLPQLFKKAGIDNYVWMRPSAWYEKTGMTKQALHFWESPDGSRVLCWHIPNEYLGDLSQERLDATDRYGYPSMLYYGVGNHGGGPTIRFLNRLEELRKKDPDKYFYGSPDEYFRAVRNEVDLDKLDVVKEDLQHHASGCYSANSKIKALNRRAEEALITGEKTDVLALALTGGEDSQDRIARAWERVMFNQFHDILAGCSIKEAYDDAYDGLRAAALVGNEVKHAASQRISWRIDTTKYFTHNDIEQRDRLWVSKGQGSPVVVFNPNAFPVTAPVTVSSQTVSGIRDEDDADVPVQIVRAPYTDGPWSRECLFETTVPAFGYRTYFVYNDPDVYKTQSVSDELKATENSLENSLIKVVFDIKTGCISEFTDKTTGRNYAGDMFGRTVVIDDSEADTWAHMIFKFDKEVGEFGGAVCKTVETGPVRATIKITTSYNNSTLVQYYSVTRESKLLTVRAKLNFGEKFRMAKLSFPADVTNPDVIYSMPFGFIKKECNGEEEPAQKWTALEGEDGRGIALINNSKYSFSANGNDLRIVIARGCGYLDHYGQNYRDDELEYQDQGPQEFEYGLMPYDRNTSDVVKASEWLNNPCYLVKETHHAGTLPCSFRGILVANSSILVQAIKISEDRTGYVVRAFETEGSETDASIELTFIGRTVSAHFKPQEIKSFLIPFDGSEIREILLTEL